MSSGTDQVPEPGAETGAAEHQKQSDTLTRQLPYESLPIPDFIFALPGSHATDMTLTHADQCRSQLYPQQN